MTWVYIIVEGQTEETFVKEVLDPHLGDGVYATPLLAGVRETRRSHKGGHRGSWQAVRDHDVLTTLKEHAPRGARVTTMLDLYALPTDFPGLEDCDREGVTDPYDKVALVEAGMAEAISDYRFIPYIQLHEFEALLFADIEKAKASYPDDVAGVDALIEDVAGIAPEMIDDGVETVPSKRIEKRIPYSEKVEAGTRIAKAIGLETIRAKCPHFDAWVAKLEGLDQAMQ